MFIQTEQTPNPASLKFLPGREVMAGGVLDFTDPERVEASPLARRLFAVEGVTGVFLGTDFITVTKAEGQDWYVLKPAVLGAIMEHFCPAIRWSSPTSRSPTRRRAERRGRRAGPPDPRADRDPGAAGGRPGRRRHHLPRLRARRRLSAHARLLRRLPELHDHAQERHREPAALLRAGGGRGRVRSPKRPPALRPRSRAPARPR